MFYAACLDTDDACELCDDVNPNRCAKCLNATSHALVDGECVSRTACLVRDPNCGGPCDAANPGVCDAASCKAGTEWNAESGMCVVPMSCSDANCTPDGCGMATDYCDTCGEGWWPVNGQVCGAGVARLGRRQLLPGGPKGQEGSGLAHPAACRSPLTAPAYVAPMRRAVRDVR